MAGNIMYAKLSSWQDPARTHGQAGRCQGHVRHHVVLPKVLSATSVLVEL